jgi:hypothetical protein
MFSFALTVPGIVTRNVQIRATRMVANSQWYGYPLPLTLAMCKEISRIFSTCGKVKKVQEKLGSRRFWKYDVIQAYIKTDSEPKPSK